MDKRTEEDKVLRAPIVVVLGGREYKIKPLVIRDSRAWRSKLVDVLAELPKYADVTTDKPDEFEAALKVLLVTMSDMVADLFFEYAKDLNREEIEGIATDGELSKAFALIVAAAFPLAQSLPAVMTKLYQ